jgi:hypothetical protein
LTAVERAQRRNANSAFPAPQDGAWRGWPVIGASLARHEKIATGDKLTGQLRAIGHSGCTSLAPCINKGIK